MCAGSAARLLLHPHAGDAPGFVPGDDGLAHLDDRVVRLAVRIRAVAVDAQVAALQPVFPGVARALLDGLSRERPSGRRHWKLERRGSFEGEERWRLEQEAHDTIDALLPTLRYVALAIAHTSGAPGRLRIDCDRLNPDSEAYNPILQMGEAVLAWDEARRITGVRVQE